ncbi:MAG: mandelate racemase/muconate lactonizing enzyme family protein [Pseudomonadota bacterium]
MNIARIDVWDFQAPFSDGPYVMSHVTQEVVHGRILRVSCDNGVVGLGEIPLSPYVLDDERIVRRTQEAQLFNDLVGRPLDSLLDIASQICGSEGYWGRVSSFGLETAYYDAVARAQQQSLCDYLGGKQSNSANDYFSISESTIEQIRDRMAVAGPTRKVIQLKLAFSDLDTDALMIATCLDAMNEQQVLMADANGGWSIEDALAVFDQFDDTRIFWEEPCKQYGDNVKVAQRSNRPVMFDQCVSNPDMARQAIADGVAAAICIKPPFLGGLGAAREIRDACVTNRIQTRIDGPWCGDIATAASLHLALGTPSDLLVAGCDLREPLNLPTDLAGIIRHENECVTVHEGVGLGIDPSLVPLGPSDTVFRGKS